MGKELSAMWWRDPRLPFGSSPVECFFPPEKLGRATALHQRVRVLHLGDLRSPKVGVLTKTLEERVRRLKELCWRNLPVTGVVIHAESALGWEDGGQEARRGFWQLLAITFSGSPEVFVENNVVFAEGLRYEFIRNPLLLAEEVGEFRLRLALDTSHAAWFYQSWQNKLFDLVEDQKRVGHLHLSDWAPGGSKGKEHLPPGEGILPIAEIRARYRGDFTTVEVRPRLSRLW